MSVCHKMRDSIVTTLLLSLFIVQIFCNVHGPPECKKKAKQVMKVIMKADLKCSREMFLHEKTYEDYMKNVACLNKCSLFKSNILHDETHMVTEATVRAAVIEKVHPEYKEKAEQTVIKCLHDHKASDLDPKDPTCKGYKDVKECIVIATSEICGVAPIF